MGMKRARDNTDEDHLDYGEPYEGAACAPPKKVQRVEASSAYGNCYANSSEEIADIKGPPKHKPITLWGEGKPSPQLMSQKTFQSLTSLP